MHVDHPWSHHNTGRSPVPLIINIVTIIIVCFCLLFCLLHRQLYLSLLRRLHLHLHLCALCVSVSVCLFCVVLCVDISLSRSFFPCGRLDSLQRAKNATAFLVRPTEVKPVGSGFGEEISWTPFEVGHRLVLWKVPVPSAMSMCHLHTANPSCHHSLRLTNHCPVLASNAFDMIVGFTGNAGGHVARCNLNRKTRRGLHNMRTVLRR